MEAGGGGGIFESKSLQEKKVYPHSPNYLDLYSNILGPSTGPYRGHTLNEVEVRVGKVDGLEVRGKKRNRERENE